MFDIKGDELEGGGQILRTVISLSSILNIPVRVFNIRAKRPNPGMQPQHVMCVKALAQLTNAEVKGLEKGSKEIIYSPKKFIPGKFNFHIGTAGSTMLVLQTMLPLIVFLQQNVQITGGTHVAWSPNFHYIKKVFLPTIEKMGCKIENFELEKYGWYPKGGGRVSISTDPAESLKAIQLTNKGRLLNIEGISLASNLPEHVAERQAISAEEILKSADYNAVIKRENAQASSTGTALTLWANYENSVIGSSALGALGKKAEKVGEEAAVDLLREIKTNACIDAHLADQILIYMALANGHSTITASELTMHTKTNIWVIEQFIDTNFSIEERGDRTVRIEVKGIGVKRSELTGIL